MNYHGCIDKCTSEYIDGWFFCKDNNLIDIYADGLLIDTINANIVREDINRALASEIVSGFRYYFNVDCVPTVIEVKFHNTNTHIQNSPIYVEKQQLRYFNFKKESFKNNKKTILFLLSTYDGGTVHTTNDLISDINNEYACLILHAFKQELALFHDKKCLGKYHLTQQVLPTIHCSKEYDKVFKQILIDYNVSIVHIRHICWHSLGLINVTKKLKIPVIFSFHDYYTLCPSHNLLDQDNKYCEGICTEGCKGSKCAQVLWHSSQIPNLKHQFIYDWRRMFETFLNKCNVFITTHQSVADIFYKHYGFLKDKIQIIEHGRSFKVINFKKKFNNKKDKITIIAPGALTPAKGLLELQKLKKLDKEDILDIHYFSNIDYNIGTRHEPYNRSSLCDVLQNIQPEVSLILSIWNETYCHTLTEMWAYGIPTVCYSLPTLKERTETSQNGLVCKNINEVYTLLKNKKFLNVGVNYNKKNNIPCMSKKYITIYRDLCI
jgi:glycosyltransferase involved in cell wall biosynthesis